MGYIRFSALVLALSSATASLAATPKTFRVGEQTVSGTPKTICVLEGAWADGTPFRYEAWDTCQKLAIRKVNWRDLDRDRNVGRQGRSPQVSDIPPNAEIFEVSNSYSQVLLYRDTRGDLAEVLYGD